MPIILDNVMVDSCEHPFLVGDRGARYGELFGVSLRPSPVFAEKVVLGLNGVEDMLRHELQGQVPVAAVVDDGALKH